MTIELRDDVVTDFKQKTTTFVTFSTPGRPVVQLPRGERHVKVVVHDVEYRDTHGEPVPEVLVSGPYLRTDGTHGAYHQHRLEEVPDEILQLIDVALLNAFNERLKGEDQ